MVGTQNLGHKHLHPCISAHTIASAETTWWNFHDTNFFL